MCLANRIFDALSILFIPADIYATTDLAEGSSRPERPILLETIEGWVLAASLGLGIETQAEYLLLQGLFLHEVCRQILACVDGGSISPRLRQRSIRHGVILGALAQRRLSAGLRQLGEARERELLHACHDSSRRGGASGKIIGAWCANLVEDSLRAALPLAHVELASMRDDAMHAVDLVVTYSGQTGGYIVQVKATSDADEFIRASVYLGAHPKRHDFPPFSRFESMFEAAERIWDEANRRWKKTGDPWYGSLVAVQPTAFLNGQCGTRELSLALRRAFPNI